jgi:serine/threonine-protein kinase
VIAVRLQPGTVLGGRYEIRSLLGQGGMAVVYRAHDRTLDEEVALKCLRTEISAPNLTKRFLAEIKLARKVRHKNVCGIHEYGEEGGFRYISMELIEGINLKQLIKEKGPLDAEAARELMIQLADGLEAIHEVGVIHRDLKTSNIMLDTGGVARLMDFGIAKELGFDTQTSASSGSILGTPEYMSPEQINGDDISFSSDVYALGIVLFELLTGDVPFWGDSPVVTLYKQLHEAPPLDDPRITVAPALRAILARCLAKEPAQRFQRAVEVAAALRRAVGLVTLPPEPEAGTTEAFAAPPETLAPEATQTVEQVVVAAPEVAEPVPPEPAPDEAAEPDQEREPEPAEDETPAEPAAAEPGDEEPESAPPLAEEEPGPIPAQEEPEPAPTATAEARQSSGFVRAVPQVQRHPSRPVRVQSPPPAPNLMPLVWAGLGVGLLAVGIGAGALYRHFSRPPAPATTMAGEPSATPTPRAQLPIEEGVTVVERTAVPIEEDIMIVGGETPPPTQPPPTQLAGSLPPATLPLHPPGTAGPLPTHGTPAPTAAPARPDNSAQVAALLDQAERALQTRDFAGAADGFRKAAELDPASERAAAGQKAAAAGMSAATRAFKQGRTVVEAKSADKGPPGFDTADVALRKAPDFSGRIEFEVSPPDAKPGQGFVVHVYVANDGKKTVKVSRAMVTTTQNGTPQPQSMAVEGRAIEPRTRTLLADVPMSWSESTQTWTMDVAITSKSNETMRNRLVWR